MADELAVRHQRDPTRGTREREATHQLAARSVQLLYSELRDEGHALPLLHEVHEGLETTAAIVELLARVVLEVAELRQLVAEAMPLVQQP